MATSETSRLRMALCAGALAVAAVAGCSSSSGSKTEPSAPNQATTTVLSGNGSTMQGNGTATSYPANAAPPAGNGGTSAGQTGP